MNDKKANSLIADKDKVLAVWREYQTSYNSRFSQSTIHSKPPTLFNSMNTKRDEEAAEQSLKLAEADSLGLRKKLLS